MVNWPFAVGTAIGVQSFKCYHLRENNLLEAVRQGYINCGLATITAAGIAYLAAPRWLFIYPLLILIPLNTGYLSSPELLFCCIFTVLHSLCLAFTMQKEQRSNFEGQVSQFAIPVSCFCQRFTFMCLLHGAYYNLIAGGVASSSAGTQTVQWPEAG